MPTTLAQPLESLFFSSSRLACGQPHSGPNGCFSDPKGSGLPLSFGPLLVYYRAHQQGTLHYIQPSRPKLVYSQLILKMPSYIVATVAQICSQFALPLSTTPLHTTTTCAHSFSAPLGSHMIASPSCRGNCMAALAPQPLQRPHPGRVQLLLQCDAASSHAGLPPGVVVVGEQTKQTNAYSA